MKVNLFLLVWKSLFPNFSFVLLFNISEHYPADRHALHYSSKWNIYRCVFFYGNLKNFTAWSLKQFLLHKTKLNICNILTVKIKHLKQTNLLLMDVITNCGKTKGSYVIKWTLVTQHSTSKILLKTAKFTFILL